MKTVSCHDKDGVLYDVPVDELVFRPSAYGVIIRDGKVLLSKQWDGYDFPGGGMEVSETIHETIKREVYEETGFQVEVKDLLVCESSFFSFTHNETEKKFHANTILMYFCCEIAGGEMSIENLDENEKEYLGMPEWIPLEEIQNIKFYNSVDSVRIIKEAVKKSKEEE